MVRVFARTIFLFGICIFVWDAEVALPRCLAAYAVVSACATAKKSSPSVQNVFIRSFSL